MANRFKVWPEQIGPLLLGDGVAVVWLTVTDVEPTADAQPTVRLYVPVAAVVTFAINGFCAAEVKPLGPVQL